MKKLAGITMIVVLLIVGIWAYFTFFECGAAVYFIEGLIFSSIAILIQEEEPPPMISTATFFLKSL